jgi:ribosome-binding ATPase YchF (GTP1/OBG family)|tara:strand:- start:248 stop:436 length:189 start_codon:yes stop_codon:yes gene_type:complete
LVQQGSVEVKAWPIKAGTKAIDAASAIHSDIKKGFIRAEVLSYEDLMDAGNYQEIKKRDSAS